MPIHLELNPDYRSQIEPRPLENAAKTTLLHQTVSADAEVSIVITSDEQIHDLNHQFRGIDTPTDVLSFQSHFTDPESGASYLGDVVISYPRAEAQSQAGGHETTAELQLLIVHGILHLLGHDHAERQAKERMWAAQAEILDQLGIGDIPLPK